MTGQYGPRTGVTQTDGLFKSGDARNFPWLRANGAPTIGDWFRALGYSTHYSIRRSTPCKALDSTIGS